MKLNGRSNESQRITKSGKKCLDQQKMWRVLIIEIELPGDEDESKKKS